MFTNEEAIRTLVKSDVTATRDEKDAVLQAMNGTCGKRRGDYREFLSTRAVVSFEEAAKLLGYKNSRGVYAAIRHGRLRGYYGGSEGRRASGVTSDSIRDLLSGGRKKNHR